MAIFKNITIYKILLESLRSYFTVNSKGILSELYKFCLCCVYVLQTPFNNFDTWRKRELLIAGCKWQYGQLAYVLNFLYNTIHIIIGATAGSTLFAPNIEDAGSTLFAPNIEDAGSTLFAPNIGEINNVTGPVIINIPTAIVNTYKSQIIADVNQIVLPGINYTINPI